MMCSPAYHRPFCSCLPIPFGLRAERRLIEHNAPFIQRAAAKRVVIKRLARQIAWPDHDKE